MLPQNTDEKKPLKGDQPLSCQFLNIAHFINVSLGFPVIIPSYKRSIGNVFFSDRLKITILNLFVFETEPHNPLNNLFAVS